ncbi:glycosyltransferase family 4 protein [Streptomyces sp. NK15101]|uniref:glycosyltransferase family 4 protein n=1 Tax=Streptomyces sp. NK15101 TaxID=2873261 RepID=UPI001CEC206B|nr:glycosyltransferase family 4 protein [Streptomyces sp. NK15101]
MKRPDPAVPVDRTSGGHPMERSDPFVAARAAYWKRTPRPSPGRRAAPPNLFAELVRAEYRPDGAPAVRPAVATPGDLVLAGLRRRTRAGGAPPPETCVRLLADGDRTRAAVFDAWPETVRRHGTARAAAAVRRGLHGTRRPHLVAFLLDLAAAESLVPLARPELLRLAHARERAVRHAAWRLLATYDGSLLLPGADAGTAPGSRPADAYERLLREALRAPASSAAPESTGLRPGTLVAQSMLMGHLDRPGEGLSGGLGVLLGSLGDALAETDRVAGVLTVVTACVPELEADPVLLRRRDRRHWVLRLPVDSPRQVRPEELGRHREALAWWATRLFGSLGRPVDVLHVRYADDGSLALAEAARRSGAALVFTAAPDPHRQMAERHDAPGTDPNALRQDLHRVFVADRLVDRADRVVGIAGPGGGADELLRYFPQLADGAAPDAPPEGIPPYRPPADAVRRSDSLLAAIGARLDATAGPVRPRTPTVLLTVGRLHPVKQQDVLVRAWVESGAFRESVLVCVGGSPSDDDPAERAMRARVDRAVAAAPEAAERLILLPALANADVRTLERRLADPSSGFRARYVCPSAKEEFGLAVLEAMEAGLLVAGPVRGGVPHYLVDGVNGLLIDTSCSRTLGEGLRRLLRVDDAAATAMARSARGLVRSTYSSNAMARALAGHYTAVAPRTRTGAGEPREGAVPDAADPLLTADVPAGRRIRARSRHAGGGSPRQAPGRARKDFAGRSTSPLLRAKDPFAGRAIPNDPEGGDVTLSGA